MHWLRSLVRTMNADAAAALDREYSAIRAGRAAVELADWSSITVIGADRQKFLHNFCTNDVKRLLPGGACEAFFANVKGKVVGHGLITCRAHELVVVGAPGQASRLIDHLDRYVLRDDVALRDTTAERAYLFVVGPWAGKEGVSNPPTPAASEGSAEDPHRSRPLGFGWPSFLWDLVGRPDCRLVECPTAELPLVRRMQAELGVLASGSQAFEAARIEAGTPLFGVDFDERNLPQEIGRDRQAISFTKGCYLGQETVARIDALGHVNQQLAGVHFVGATMPAVGADLTAGGVTAGYVTSATFSPRLCAPLALAMLRREFSQAGRRLDSPVGACEIVALPL